MKNLKSFGDFHESSNEINEGHDEYQNYMFFQNLMTIQKKVKKMLSLDKSQVDTILSAGHGWAVDHISTSKDDIDEVCDWICNKIAPSES
jgi:hypothetical protein